MSVRSPLVTPRSRAAHVLVLIFVLTACGGTQPTTPQAGSPDRAPATGQPDAPEGEASRGELVPVGLSVSNQSFDDPTVELTIKIDGKVVMDQQLEVDSQHTWVGIELALPAGDHELVATSDSGLEDAFTFSIPADEPRYLTLAYWWYSHENEEQYGEESKFTFDVRDEPHAIA